MRETTHTLHIPAPDQWLNTNDRDHWATRNRKTQNWRQAAKLHARAHRLPKGATHAHITAHTHKTHNRDYDAHNLTPTAKAIIDGLATGKGRIKGYGLIPDDNNTHLTGPDMRMGDKRERPGVTLIITLRWAD